MRESLGVGAFVSGQDVFTIVADVPAAEPDGPLDGGRCGELRDEVDRERGAVGGNAARLHERQLVFGEAESTGEDRDRAERDRAEAVLRVEEAVVRSGLAYTLLRPGGFASNAARWSWGVRGESAVPLPYPDAVQAPIHEQDIADVAVVALTTDALVGAAPVLTGPERLTLREQVALIGEVIGRPVAVIEQTEAESSAMLSRFVPEV